MASPRASDAKKRWAIAFAASFMNAIQSGAFFFTPTTLMPLIVSDFGVPMSLSTVPIALGKVAYVLLLIPGGILVDHFGPRRCVFTGILGLAVVITVYAAFVTSFAAQLVSHVLMAVFAAISGVPVYSIFIAQWFHGGIGLAMGLVLAGYSAAGTAIPALLGPIAAALGWRAAMAFMCFLLWTVGLPVAYFLLEEHVDHGHIVGQPNAIHHDMEAAETHPLGDDKLQAPENPSSGIPDRPLADQMSWTFVGFAFSYILLQYCFGCFGENIMFFLTIDRDMKLGMASLFFSALNLSAFSAKLVGGHLGDRFDRFHVASAASGLASVGIFFLFISPPGLDDRNVPLITSSPTAVVIFTVLFGFGYGATFNSLYALTPIVFGKQNLGRTQSALFGLGLCGNAVGSVLTGVFRSDFGTYQRAFLIAAVACTANFFVFNVTRMTLGGSMEGLKKLATDPAEIRTGRYAGIEELDAVEEAIKRQIGSDGGPEPGRTIGGTESLPNLRNSQLLGMIAGTGSVGTGHYELRRSTSRHDETGMTPEGGYPIVRDWSSGRLSPSMSRSSSRQRLRRSSTLEAMIESGILSASLEAVGYVGMASTPRRTSAFSSPVARTSTPDFGASTAGASELSPLLGTSWRSPPSEMQRLAGRDDVLREARECLSTSAPAAGDARRRGRTS